MTVVAIHRDPFSFAPHVFYPAPGESLEQIAAKATTLPEGWPRHAGDVLCVNGHPVPRGCWPMVRPHGRKGAVEVTLHAPPMGGGGGDGKNVLAVVASIGLTLLSGGIASGAILGGLTGAAAAGQATVFSRLLGAGVALLGSTALSALAPSPVLPQVDDPKDNQPGSASARGNILEPNAPLPRVVGTRKVFPPFVTEPFVYYDGEDEVVEVLAAMAGPHQLEQVRVGDAEIDEMQGVTYTIHEGFAGESPLQLLSRYARTRDERSELAGHRVTEDSGTTLDPELAELEDALPQAKILATRRAPDEFWIGLSFPQGLFLNDTPETLLRVPVRLQMRERGSETWINLPELHFAAARIGEKRATIKLVWRDTQSAVSAASTRGWCEARITSPEQSGPVIGGWQADSYFDVGGSGDHWVDDTNAGDSDVKNVILDKYVAEINLDRAVFPQGQYEVRLQRGYAFKDSAYASAGYTIASTVRDPFFYENESTPQIYQSKEKLSDTMFVSRASSVWNSSPARGGNVTLIEVRARNVALNQLSVLASGYVRDYVDGEGWVNWTTTSNPAPHLRDILVGELNAEAVPASMIDDASFLAWRDRSHTCDAIIDGQSVRDAARIVAGSGFAQLYEAETFGVVEDKDRSEDDPVQYFGPHNMARFSWSKGFAKSPDGYRASFVDSEADYNTRQIIHPDGAIKTEQVTIEGKITEADVRARLDYDIAALQHRGTFYSWDAPAEAIVCRRGSLVGVAADMLSDQYGSGRVQNWEMDASGDLVAVHLDQAPPVNSEPAFQDITDLRAVADVRKIGLRTGMVLRRASGVHSVHEVTTDSEGTRLVLATPTPVAGLDLDDLAIIGPLSREVRRLIIDDMEPRDGFTWTITAVSEAPEIHNAT